MDDLEVWWTLLNLSILLKSKISSEDSEIYISIPSVTVVVALIKLILVYTIWFGSK